MPYAPDAGDSLVLSFSGSPSYTPAQGDALSFDDIVNVSFLISCISDTFSANTLSIQPHLGIASLNVIALLENTSFEDVQPGTKSLLLDDIPSIFTVNDIVIGRGTQLHLVQSYVQTKAINISTGPIALSLNVIESAVVHQKSRSTICFSVNLLSFSSEIYDTTVVPGNVSISFDVIEGNTQANDFDAIYEPKKGLGPINIQPYYAVTHNNTSNNGGVISNRRINDQFNAIFPAISKEFLQSGVTLYRKVFWRNISENKSNLLNGIIYIDKEYNNDCIFTLIPCGFTETQSSIDPSAREYGTGILTQTANKGDTVLYLDLKNQNLDTFKNLDTVSIQKLGINEKFDNVLVSKTNNHIILTLPSPLVNTYNVGDTVSSCINLNTLSTYIPKIIVNSTNGLINQDFIIGNYGDGGIKTTWTITFLNTSQFKCSTNNIPDLFGDIYSDFFPINPITNSSYFYIDYRMWKGVYAQNDTVVFSTQIVSTAVWVKLIIPQNSSSRALSRFNCAIQGYI